MTQEQKAKAYDEALERAKKQLEDAKVFDYKEGQIAYDIRTTTYAIFPELKESEDEEIRKELLAVINDLVLPDEQKTRFNAWLEKQKEQKPAEWSEEDERMRINIINALTPQLVYSVGKGTYTGTSTYKYDDEIKWLKSLRPQPKVEWNEEAEPVDLENEIDRLWDDFSDEISGPHNKFDIYARVARHFYELGLNAKNSKK